MTGETPTESVSELVDSDDIPGALRSLDRSLHGIQYRMDRKFLRNLTVMLVGLLVIVVFVTVAVVSLVKVNDKAARAQRSADAARAALADYKQATVEARVGSCEQFNLQQDVQIKAEITQSHDLVAALSRGIADPVDRERQATAYNQTHDAVIREGHPHRDCTEAGIEEYLRGIPRATTTTKGKP